MPNSKKELRYTLFLSAIFSVFIFFILLLSNKIESYFRSSIYTLILGLAATSIFIALVIVFSFTLFSSRAEKIITILRRRYRFENLSNPLLLRLSYEAPGTYHHSLNVSNLAQRACKEIGADSLLARVGAYYHDIGKLKNPIKFIENQAIAEIPKSESQNSIKKDANEIIAHVKNGIAIAKENNLPEDMIALILEHHGTTRAEYFFERAKEKGTKVKYTDFRYPGPTPQSKEAAVLMLADAVEAIARTKEFLNNDVIAEIVTSTIENKISGGQLRSAKLSESDIAKIRSSLITTLSSIYHQRISY